MFRSLLGLFTTTGRKTRDYLLRFTRRCERSGGQAKAKDVGAILSVEIAIEQRNLGGVEVTEFVSLVGNAVAVAIAQRNHAASLQRDEDIAVRRNRDVSRIGKAVGKNGSAESFR